MTEWTREHLRVFLEECFKDFEYRSLGLLVLASYTLAQPVHSLRSLTWGDVDLENRKVKVNGMSIHTEDYLVKYLKEQKELWDFQEFVFPYHRKTDNAYRAMSIPIIRNKFTEVKDKLGSFPDYKVNRVHELRLKEMLDEGVDPLYLLSLTGAKKRKDLLKYLRDFESIANRILTERQTKWSNSNPNQRPGDRRLNLIITENQ